MDHAPTGRLPAPRTRSLNSLSAVASDAESKRVAARSRSPAARGLAPPPPPGAPRTSSLSRPTGASSARSVSPSPRPSTTGTTTRTSVMSTTGARTVTRGAPPPPPVPVRSSFIRAPSPNPRRASMPQLGDESEATSAAQSKPGGHTRSASTAGESSGSKPAGRQLTQPVAPSFMNRTKPQDKRVSTTRAPPPAPARKVPPAAAAKAQELQARLDALKKTTEQIRKSTPAKPGFSGIKRPGEKSAPSSPRMSKSSSEVTIDNILTKVETTTEQEARDEVARNAEKEKEEIEERAKQEELEKENARKQQEELVREQQARKESIQMRAAAALERKLAEEKRAKLDAERVAEEEASRKLLEQQQREHEEEARRKQEQLEREEAERRRLREQREEELREQERRAAEQRKQLEEEERQRRVAEQERILQQAAETEKEELRLRLEKEEEERQKAKAEEERLRLAAAEEARKQREEEERRREEERRQQLQREAEERRRQDEERRQQLEREAEERRKQEEERRKQVEREEEERRKQEEEWRKQKEKEDEERRLANAKEEEERKAKLEKERRDAEEAKAAKLEKERRDAEEAKARQDKLRVEANRGEQEGGSNLSTITKAKIAGGARKARTGLKFDASASTDVVKAKPGVLTVDSAPEPKIETRESEARSDRKPFMGVGIPGMAGLAQQATAGLANLKRSGDRGAPKSPSSRKGQFEITFKAEGGKTAQAVACEALDALDNVAKGQAWVILGYNEDTYSFVATGEGVGQASLDAMKPYLAPTNINFLYFHSGQAEKEDAVVKGTEIMWQGDKTKLLVKARAGASRETLHLFVKRCFTIGVQKEASEHDDLDMTRIFGSGGEVTSSPNASLLEPEAKPQLLTPRRASAVPGPTLVVTPSRPRTPSEFKGAGATGSNPLRPDIQWTGQEEIAKAVKEFLATETPGAFFVLDIEGAKKNEVKVAASGTGALTDEWREKHCGATKCSVFVIKAENKESGYVSLEKIVYIQWVGRQVKILEKGRAKEIYSSLKEYVREQCGTLAGELEVLEGQAQDVNLQAVTESITGSRQRGSSNAAAAKKVERATGAPVDLSYADEEALRNIIADISQEKQTWVALTYSTNRPATLEILGSGVGENTSISWGKEPTREQEEEQNKRDRMPDTPTAQYKKYCKQSNIVFIVHRFLRIPEQFQFSKDLGSYAKSHFGLMMWQGEDCRVMDKAASSHHWKDFCNLVRDIMEKAGVYVEAGVYVATKLEELNPRDIRKGMRMDMY